MKKILFCFQQVGGVNALLPLIEQLQDDYELLITGRPLVCENMRQRGMTVIPYFYREHNDVPFSVDLAPFAAFSPDLLITDTISFDRAPEGIAVRQFWQFAAQKKIPSIAYMDCWWGYNQRFVLPTEKEAPLLPDYIGVVDEYARHDFVDHGFPQEAIVVLGCPRFEFLYQLGVKNTADNRLQQKEALGVPRDNVVLLFVSQPLDNLAGFEQDYGFTEKTTLTALLQALQGLPEEMKKRFSLFVLLHPEESEKALDEIIQKEAGDISVSYQRAADPVPYVLAADLVTGMFSFLLAEAVVMLKPVLSIQPNLRREEILITNLIGATLSINDTSKLRETLCHVLVHPHSRKELLKKQEKFAVVRNCCERWQNFIERNIGQNLT